MTKQIVAYSFSSASPELLWCHSAGRIEGGPDYAYAHRKGLPRTTLFLTCEGAGTFRVGRRTWVAREPSVTLLLPTASPAEWRTEDQKWTFWWIDCLGAGWKEYLSQFGTAPRARTHEIGIEGANRLQEQFRRLIASHRTPNARSRFLFQTIGMELILGLLEATTFQLGDDVANRQYRAIVSFDTGSMLPANAVIKSAMLQIKQAGAPVGGNPLNILGMLWADIRKGAFGATALQLTDFNAPASAARVGYFNKIPSVGWYTSQLNAAGLRNINRFGLTQLRLYFATDDNNDHKANYMKFECANYPDPQPATLTITYSVP